MTEADLDALILRILIDVLSDRAVAALRTRRRSALLLFTGTTLGLEPAMAALQALGADGWNFTGLLSPRARILLPSDCLRAAGAGPAATEDIETLLDGSGLVIVPTLTVTTAAKLAGTVRDSQASCLLARALERGVKVVAAVDGCCPDNEERAVRGFRANEAYRARMRANLESLRLYGVHLTVAAKLAAAVKRLAPPMPGAAPAPLALPSPVGPTPPAAAPAAKRIFSRSDAVQFQGRELSVGPTLLITPAAADELRRRNIRVTHA